LPYYHHTRQLLATDETTQLNTLQFHTAPHLIYTDLYSAVV